MTASKPPYDRIKTMALGWDMSITRQLNPPVGQDGKYRGLIGSWMASHYSENDGWGWAESLVVEGLAKSLGGHGYPYSYTITASSLIEVIKRSSLQFAARFDKSEIAKCSPNEQLLLEVWDRS